MAKSPFYSSEHEQFRASLRRFVAAEIEPHVGSWDERGEFPRELYRKAADIGILQVGFPEQYGGVDADLFFSVIIFQELARPGSGGVSAGLLSHTIALPPIIRGGSAALKSRIVPEILSGTKIAALAITEPDGGSDVASLRLTARRDGDHYVLKGTKTFITSGMRADYFTVAVRTGEKGRGGISAIVVDGSAAGLSRTPLKKMGWWSSDTATLIFDDVRVPIDNLLAHENEGFRLLMQNFNQERIALAAGATAFAQVCFDEALAYAKERKTFGSTLIEHQVIRHKLADMRMRIDATQAMLELVTWQTIHGEDTVGQICLLKNQASLTMEFCAREGVQILGGAGFMRGPKVERIYREARVNGIGGGSEEMMRELAARQLGWFRQ